MYGEQLIKLRRKHGLTQKQFAEALMLSQSMVSKIERGITRLDLTLAIRIADFYNVSLDYLFGRSDKKSLRISEETIAQLSDAEKDEMLLAIIKQLNKK
ncbi:MAG: helix-turn-helix domain-containing protein [Bacilli bacterium]|jgi:transcriptional regulator with XRE-family HTH domain